MKTHSTNQRRLRLQSHCCVGACVGAVYRTFHQILPQPSLNTVPFAPIRREHRPILNEGLLCVLRFREIRISDDRSALDRNLKIILAEKGQAPLIVEQLEVAIEPR